MLINVDQLINVLHSTITMTSAWLPASDAAAFLGVKRSTLYAYAARGKIRVRPADDGRRSLYARSDLERVEARRDARAGHGAVAAGALRWGEPVLDSAITSIRDDGPWYRGRNACAWAREAVGVQAGLSCHLLMASGRASRGPCESHATTRRRAKRRGR